MEMMKAAILTEAEKFEIQQVAKPKIEAEDEILVRVLVCSICGTDVSFYKNPQSKSYGSMIGRILGHEIVGEVVEVGKGVTQFKKGDRIVCNPNSFCDRCLTCKQGYRNHCENMELMGITTSGGFAEYTKTKESLAYPVALETEINHAAFAEPLSCAMNGFSRLDITPGDTCCVIGCGPIGLLFAQMAQKNGARVVCLEINPNRLAKAKELGFDTIKPEDPEQTVALLRKKWGRRANYVIDAAGGQLPTAIQIAEFCGKILCFASPRQVENANLGPLQSKELTVMGSFIIKDSMSRAITAIENGYLNLDPIITHELPLEEINEGMRLLMSGAGMEIILKI